MDQSLDMADQQYTQIRRWVTDRLASEESFETRPYDFCKEFGLTSPFEPPGALVGELGGRRRRVKLQDLSAFPPQIVIRCHFAAKCCQF